MSEQKLLLFRKWDTSEIEIKDLGLKTAISLKQIIMPLDFGRSALKRYNKGQVNIVERLANKLMHFGKKLPIEAIKKCKKIGISSGASAPEQLVQNLIKEIKKDCLVSIEEVVVADEKVIFKIPKELN